MTEPIDLDAKRLKAFKPLVGKDGSRRTPGPGRGHKTKIGNDHIPGMEASGPGWGGAAKGEGKDLADVATHLDAAELRARMPAKAAASDQMLGIWYHIATKADTSDSNRIVAAEKLVEHIDGKAIQRIMANTVETVEEIRTKDPEEAAKEYQRVIQGR
jgi:hypothetical protein